MTKRTLTPAEIGDTVRTTRKAAGLRQDEEFQKIQTQVSERHRAAKAPAGG